MNIFVFLHQLIFFARTGGSDSSSGGGGGALVILAGSVGIAVTVPSIFLIYKWTRSIVAAYSIGTIVGLALAPIAFAIKLHPNLIRGYSNLLVKLRLAIYYGMSSRLLNRQP